MFSIQVYQKHGLVLIFTGWEANGVFGADVVTESMDTVLNHSSAKAMGRVGGFL